MTKACNDRSLYHCIQCKKVDEADELEEAQVLLHKTYRLLSFCRGLCSNICEGCACVTLGCSRPFGLSNPGGACGTGGTQPRELSASKTSHKF